MLPTLAMGLIIFGNYSKSKITRTWTISVNVWKESLAGIVNLEDPRNSNF